MTKPASERRNLKVAVLLTDQEMTDLEQVIELHNRALRDQGFPNSITKANFIRGMLQKEFSKLHKPPIPEPLAQMNTAFDAFNDSQSPEN